MPFETKELSDFLGRGFTLPMKLEKGRPPLESGFELIKSSIKMILSWQLGKRPFLSEFGSQLFQLIEEPNDDILQNLVEIFVIDAINKWEHRIERVESKIERTSDISLNLQVKYRIIATQSEDSFIFPFYRQIIY